MGIHPRKNEQGKSVTINHPSKASPIEAWASSDQVGVVLPDGPMPPSVGSLKVQSWSDVPTTNHGWETLKPKHHLTQPAFEVPPGLDAAAGVIILEPDARVWIVAPTNRFGGYAYTFPKGRIDAGVSLEASAIREAWEEAGLQVALLSFFLDVRRSVTFSRYYLAKRLGGNPADMGWESQAALLVPIKQLPKYLTNASDQPLLRLDELLAAATNL